MTFIPHSPIQSDFLYDHVILGGGITGVGIFHAFSHGQKAQQHIALIEASQQFVSQTSSKSSKMLHGGIRYLEQGHFDLVTEALREKYYWTQIYPDLCQEMTFTFPHYSFHPRPALALKCGMLLYDFLERRQEIFLDRRSYWISKKHCQDIFPHLKQHQLIGAGLYRDSVMDDFQLGLRVLKDAYHQRKNHYPTYATHLQTHTSVEALEWIQNHKHWKITLSQHSPNTQTSLIYAKKIISALGPYTDSFMQKINLWRWQNCLCPSQGSHFYLSKKVLPISQNMVLASSDKRIIFLIQSPFKPNHVLVGTTEVILEKPLDVSTVLNIQTQEVDYLLSLLKEFFPQLIFRDSDIEESYVGVRPLLYQPKWMDDTTKTTSLLSSQLSRSHEIFYPHKSFTAILGGKYTTFRLMGEDVANFSQALRV